MVQFMFYFPLKCLGTRTVRHWVFSSGHGNVTLRSRQAPSEDGNLKFLQLNLHKPISFIISEQVFPSGKLSHELCI